MHKVHSCFEHADRGDGIDPKALNLSRFLGTNNISLPSVKGVCW